MRKIEATSRVGRGGGRDSPAPSRATVGMARWTEESAKKPQDTKAARGNREPYNDDRNLKYALRLYLHHLLSILAGRQVTRLSSGSNLISSDPRPDPRRGRAGLTPGPPAAPPGFPHRRRADSHSNASHHAHPHRAQRGRARKAFKAHRSGRRSRTAPTLVKRASASSRRKARVHTCQQQHGWAALIRRRSKHGWAALIRRRSSCAERANSAESARENHNREASRPALPNGLQIRVRLAIAIRE